MTTTRPTSTSKAQPRSEPRGKPRGEPKPTQSLDELLAAQEQRRSIARMGAYALYEQYSGKDLSARRMATRMRRYEERIDPTGDLKRRDPQDLARRVKAALNLDMEKVRYARTQRAADRRALQQMLLRTPSDDVSQLGAIAAALSLNQLGDLTTTTAKTAKTEAASTSMEAAPKPLNLRKQAKIVSSDGGAGSVSHAPRRRQTSPATSPKRASKGNQQKAATSHDSSTKHNLN